MRKSFLQMFYGDFILESRCNKINVSGIFDKILYISDGKLKGSSLDLFTLSGHDTTITAVLRNILDVDHLKKLLQKGVKDQKIYEFLIPGFASSMFFELRKSPHGIIFMRIIYNGKILKEGLHKDLKYDEDFGGIEYKMFKKYLLSIIDTGFRKLYCKSKFQDKFLHKSRKIKKLIKKIKKSNKLK